MTTPIILAFFARAFPLIRKGSLALVAQILISGVNFVLSLLLARWLATSEYGVYTLAFTIFLVVSSVHNALLLEPMGVLGPALHGKSLPAYLGKLVRLHFMIAIILAIAMAFGALLFSRLPRFADLSVGLIGASLATPWILFLWFARQAAYLKMRADIVAKAALGYAIAVVFMIFALHLFGRLTPFSAFVTLAVASSFAGTALIAWIRPKFHFSTTDKSFAMIWRQHWVYGRWVLVTALIYWVSGQAAYYFIAAAFLKMDDVGTISALQNLVAPLSQFLTALSLLFLPWASTRLAGNDTAAFRRGIWQITLLFTGIGILYVIAVVGFGRQLTALLYHGKYRYSADLILMLALSQGFIAASQGPVIGLRAMQRPSRIFIGYSVSAIFSILVGFALTRYWGTLGNVIGMAASSFCFLAVTTYCYRAEQKRQEAQEAVQAGTGGSSVRVAWLLPSMDRGSCWQPLLKEFAKEFPDTTVFTGKWNGYLRGFEETFRLRCVSGYRFITLVRRSNGYDRGFFWTPVGIIPELYKFHPAIIFTSAFSLWTLYALIFKMFTGARVIILWEGNSPSTDYQDSHFRLRLRALMGHFADRGVSNMQAGVEYLHTSIGMSRRKLLYHPYEVPDSAVLCSGKTELEPKSLRRPVFLFVGSLISRKGWSALVDATNILSMRGIGPFSVIFIGTGEQEEELNTRVRLYGLGQYVHQLGKVSYQSLGSYYRAADVFVFPTHEDTWGLVLLEAMSFGKAVLCSINAGSREMVTHGENGFVFDSKNPKELADYMAKFIADPTLITRFGICASETVAPFTPVRAARALAGLARETISPSQVLPAAPASRQKLVVPGLVSERIL